MRIPQNQIKLLQELGQANSNLVGIISAGSAIEMPWHRYFKALLHCYLNGQAGAGAILDLLTGAVNPSGKLNETIPRRLEDTACYRYYPSQQRNSEYRESIYVGYRYYEKAARWIREGGLFVIVSNLITVFKYLMLQFLPKAFAGLPMVEFGWPGKEVTLFGETFKWNIIGYDVNHGGLPYFCAYMVAMVIGECINFPIQRSLVFRSKEKVGRQIAWYVFAFCIITCIVNSINCVWVAVAGKYVADFVYNIGTTVLNGGISMVVFFFVNKLIFPAQDQVQVHLVFIVTNRTK